MTQQPFTAPLPLDMERFYNGYRTRLENKLRHKNTQIARAERLLPNLPPDQKPALEALLQQSIRDRDEIQTELYDIYKTLEAACKIMGKDCRTASTDILSHPNPGAVDLIGTRFTAQLLDDFDNLINPSRSDRVPPSLQTTKCRDRNAAGAENLSVQTQAGALTTLGESTGFQG